MKKKQLQLKINKEIKNSEDEKAKVSLLIYRLDEPEEVYSHNKDNRVISASLIKAAIMLTALGFIMEDKLNTNTPIQVSQDMILEDTEVFEYGAGSHTLDEILNWMIINSDNTAANVLIDYLGMDSINRYCRKLNLENTIIERKMLDFKAVELGLNNYTSAEDMLKIYKALNNHSILNDKLCDYALGILKRQRDKKLSMRYIYDDIKAAHKTGSLDYLRHDAGIFYLDNVTYYFGAFIYEAPSDDYASKWIGRISKLVYEYYKL